MDVSSLASFLYVGHDIGPGVQVSNGPVRRNQTAEGKFSPVRARMKEAQSKVRRTRTESGYKAYSRVSLHNKTTPKP